MNIDFVDFDDEPIEVKSVYQRDGKPRIFTETTMEYYRTIREEKIDPLTYIEMGSCPSAFIFADEWDPYTGERCGKDPIGPLYFDPDIIINLFYRKRLDLLWVNESDTNAGVFEGYYDGGVGSGEDLYIVSRGSHPELYPFRLPITNCYLTPDHKLSFITMGPKLTDAELESLDRLASQQGTNYMKIFRKKRPSVLQMKKLYDQAISQTPDISCVYIGPISDLTSSQLLEYRDKANRLAVDKLRAM